jgi:hypothetical protein
MNMTTPSPLAAAVAAAVAAAFLAAPLLAQDPAPAAPAPQRPLYPDPADVIAAMVKAAHFYRSQLAVAGGYAKSWPEDLATSVGDNSSSPTLTTTQPPGTPAMGMAFLRAYQVAGEPVFRQAALEAAQHLSWIQLATGGWRGDHDLAPGEARQLHYRRDLEAGDTSRGKRHAEASLDDGKTESPLLFLLELVHTPGFEEETGLRRALDFGFNGLLAAQAPNGGWPQRFSEPADPEAPVAPATVPGDWPRQWPEAEYGGHYTLNDGNILRIVRLLLRAHELAGEGDPRFLAAARKAGDFLLLARLPDPHPAWAQQYDRDMKPAWARRFEPPAASSAESVGALNALLDLWLATGDSRYREPLEPVVAWLESARLPDGQWARFYELGTNRPVYCARETYELTYDDTDLPNHYSFKVDDIDDDLDDLKAAIASTRDELLADAAPPANPKGWTSKAKGQAKKTNDALDSLTPDGYWLRNGKIDAAEFVKHFKAMTLYAEGAKHGGETFDALRAEGETGQ